MRRRGFLCALALFALARPAHAAPVRYPAVRPGYRFAFPRDHGAHAEFRTEWWYVTGWLEEAGSGAQSGFQITFFRTRLPAEDANPSRFAPRQIFAAHAALADPLEGRLVHDQRAARAGLGLAGAAEGRAEVWLDDWRFEQSAGGFRSRIAARAFRLALDFEPGAPPLLQGEGGYSQKGHRPQEASRYYSLPQLAVQGVIERGGRRRAVRGRAWLDHEWSSAYLAPEAAGWDWIGINLADGGALMLFRMRAKTGGVHYAGGTWRGADGSERRFAAQEVGFETRRRWRSPRTGVEYPVALSVRAGGREWRIEPLMDDQELDARASSGTIYWEGAVSALDDGVLAGRGYLELTGYWRDMVL